MAQPQGQTTVMVSASGEILEIRGVGGSGKQSLSRLAAYISSIEVFQMTLRKGYGIPDMMKDLSTLYMKTGVKNIGTVFLMSDAQVSSLICENFQTIFPPTRLQTRNSWC